MASIRPMPNQIELYEEISALSARMVAAARENDWDSLIELEQHVATLRQSLMTADAGTNTADEIERKRALIQRILDDDAEIRRHTEPWMEHVRQFLGAGAKQTQVERAYGAVGGFGSSG